jgi:hypothetical protein
MATIAMEFVDGPSVGPLQNQPGNDARWGRGDFMLYDLGKINIATSNIQNIYRGFLAGNYVYNIGSPPVGATDIVVIGKTKG